MDRQLNVSIEEYLDALVDEYGLQPAPPGSFTPAEFARRAGIGLTTAERVLKAEVAAGRLKSAGRLRRGKRCNVYWRE